MKNHRFICRHYSYEYYVLFIKQARVLYQHIKAQREAECLDSDKAQTASFINGFKNNQSYELMDEEILKIQQV